MKHIGIDLGTANTIIYMKGKGIVLREPSVVAVDSRGRHAIAVGREAKLMLGKTPGSIKALCPLRDGVIAEFDATAAMLRHFFKKVSGNTIFSRPKVIICIPYGVTEVERRAVEDVTLEAGAQSVALIEEPVAAAIGAGLRIADARGSMIVDIGGGTCDVAVISLGGVVVSESIKVAGDKFDEAIIRYVRRRHNVLIGERTAEEIKIKVGCAWQRDEPRVIEVKGRCLVQGLPKVVRISSLEMPDALEEPITAIIEAVCSVIERTPPELVGDILYNGIVMTGGGSLLFGLDRLIANGTGIKTRIADKAVSCVAIGTGLSLENISSIPEGAINISRQRQKQY